MWESPTNLVSNSATVDYMYKNDVDFENHWNLKRLLRIHEVRG